MAFDTTRLVTQMNLKGALPEGRFQDQELLDLAYDSLLSEITPLVLSARQEFYVREADTATVANTQAYPIQSRAMNGILRDVKLIQGNQIITIPEIDPSSVTTTQTGTPNSFFMRGNDICLYPTPSTSAYTLRQSFFVRPSRLVPVSECAKITNITGLVVTAALPSTWTSSDTFDLVHGRSHFGALALDQTATVSGNTVTFASLPATLMVGDYITLAEESCFPFLPPEGQVALVQSAVTTALEAIGDQSAIAVSSQKAQFLIQQFASQLSTRVQATQSLGTSLA